ncbi:MAG: hypothetical protein QOH93_1913 [Chloroflexia bacterium]|jgi:hypothetical protein|nr:hypothetical protein [Chloroflexia bacterium]
MAVYQEVMNSLEQLFQTLIKEDDASVEKLWRIERELITLQLQFESSLASGRASQKNKATKIKHLAQARENDWKAAIRLLQHEQKQVKTDMLFYAYALNLSRALGDALAWLCFDMNEQLMAPLAQNQSARVLPDGKSLKGMLAVAEALANKGVGFPLLHDATRILRIGDITFVQGDKEPLTVEVKTHSATPTERGITYDTTVATVGYLDKWQSLGFPVDVSLSAETQGDPQDSVAPAKVRRIRASSRFSRQMHRMALAFEGQSIERTKLVKIGDPLDQEIIMVREDLGEEDYHRLAMYALLAEAKQKGYASITVDGAFLYVAMYSDSFGNGPWWENFTSIFNPQTRKDLNSNSILYEDETLNLLYYGSSWSLMSVTEAPMVRPFFIYRLDNELLIDMLYGRLGCYVFVNVGRLVEVLRDRGFDARLRHSSRSTGLPLEVETTVSLDSESFIINLGSLHDLGWKIIYDYLSLDAFVKLVCTMSDGMKELLPEITSRRDLAG